MDLKVKCPICLEEIISHKIEPDDGWKDEQTEVKCIICKNNFYVTVDINPRVREDFDYETFKLHFDPEQFPADVAKEFFYDAMRCIINDNQSALKIGFDGDRTKASFEFAIIHHQRVKRSLMPQEKKKAP